MITKIIDLKNYKNDKELTEKLFLPAKALKSGELVAFPTETVYGLGANALDERALSNIFTAKGRPSDNPLIVHVADISQIGRFVREIPQKAVMLAEAFWPGPLTMVFEKSELVSYKLTGGLETVALRVPDHAIARTLINLADVPVAAPSANASGKPSTVTAEHVYDDMNGKIPYIIDGGRCDVGLESTVLSLTGDKPVLLRPGGITVDQITAVIGKIDIADSVLNPMDNGQAPAAPGMKYKHYSPKAEVMLFHSRDKMIQFAAEQKESGKNVGILALDDESYGSFETIHLGDTEDKMAANLFNALRQFDKTDVDIILAPVIHTREKGLAIMNRLLKAAGFNIVDKA